MASNESGAVVSLGPWDQRARAALRRMDAKTLRGKPAALAELSDLEASLAIKAMGVDEAPLLLSHATPEQARALLDFEAWAGGQLQPSDALLWLGAFRSAGIEPLVAAVRAWDRESAVALLSRRLLIADKPDDETPPEDVPDWLKATDDDLRLVASADGRFVMAARTEDPDTGEEVSDEEQDAILRLVDDLYRGEDWEAAVTLLRQAMTDDRFDLEELGLRFRDARLEELGFPPRGRALELYAPLVPEDGEVLGALAPGPLVLAAPYVPAEDDSMFVRAVRRIEEPSVVRRVESELVPLVNAILVADRAAWSDPDAIAAAVDKAVGGVSGDLGPDEEAAASRLRTTPLKTLFRRGYTRGSS